MSFPTLTLPKIALITPKFAQSNSSHPIQHQIPTPNIPQVPTPKIPQVLTQNIPQVLTPKIPQVLTLKIPQAFTPNIPQVLTPKIPQVLTPNIPQVLTPKIPQVLTPKIPQVLTPKQFENGVQLVMPKIATPRITTPRVLIDNPWLPEINEGSSDIKIAGITPIGTIALVPTANERPPATPRKIPMTPPPLPSTTPTRNLTLNIIPESDPILNASIYLDFDNKESYDHVSNKMRSISSGISDLQRRYTTELKLIPNIFGRVSQQIFDELLAIYENNQVYYQDRIDDKQLDTNVIRECLTKLEHWFICVIEPYQSDDIKGWTDREKNKLIKGITSYCDPELYNYIIPIGSELKEFIRQQHVGLL